jgi:predicted nucleic acid-binding Zn ribbon protein
MHYPKNDMKLGDAIMAYLKALGLDKKLKERSVVNSWEEVVGLTVAKSTDRIELVNKVLYVYLSSSVVRHQLSMMKSGIVDALNRRAGEIMVRDIVFR